MTCWRTCATGLCKFLPITCVLYQGNTRFYLVWIESYTMVTPCLLSDVHLVLSGFALAGMQLPRHVMAFCLHSALLPVLTGQRQIWLTMPS